MGGFAAGSFLGNSKDECNPSAAELQSQKGLPLWGMHAHIAGVSPLTVLAVDRALENAAGHGLLLSPFCRESIAGRAASDTAG